MMGLLRVFLVAMRFWYCESCLKINDISGWPKLLNWKLCFYELLLYIAYPSNGQTLPFGECHGC